MKAKRIRRFLELSGRGPAARSLRRMGRALNSCRSLSWLLLLALLLQSVMTPALNAANPAAGTGGQAPRSALKSGPRALRSSPAQDTETIIVYGPRRIEATGLLTKFNDQFTLPADANAPFTLQVQNGLPDGSGRALIGNVKLNGSALYSSTELYLQVPSLAQQVTLAVNNTLEVSFISRRVASLTITVTATRHVTPIPPPVITDFNPKGGAIGTAVTLTGTGLRAEMGQTVVTFAGPGNTRVPALISSATANAILTTVPNGSITGPIEVTTTGGQTATKGVFTVSTPQDFQLTVAPALTTTIQRGTATQIVTLTSQQPDFTQLAQLKASGLPPGVSATFAPPKLTSGASSTLSLSLSNVNLSPGSYSFSISGTASVEGRELVHSVPATLNVMAAGQTTLAGRVLSIENEPVMGATISLDGQTTTTDAAGSFLLSGVTAGPARPLMIDGRTASAPNRTYPLINEPANIVANQANVIPYVFFLPPIDVQYEVDVVPGRETIATNPRVENLQMTIPAGANLRNRDGSPVARTSITPLQIDRTPTPLPPNVMTALVYTSQPGGATSSIPIPVVYPNLTGADPGTRCQLYAFNHDTVQWYVYGWGRVSADGLTIVPETDPATGRPYGLKDFSWHFPAPPTGPCSGPGCNPNDPDGCGGGNYTGNPVNLSSGVKVERATDFSFGGSRGGLSLTRIYTSDLGGQGVNGPFGRGATHSYDVRIINNTGQTARVVFPGEQTGRLFTPSPLNSLSGGPAAGEPASANANGYATIRPVGVIGLRGDELHLLPDGTYEYLRKDGDRWRFNSAGRLTTMTDPNGNAITLTYSGNDLTQITDPAGRSITFQYDSASRISSATEPLGRTWNYQYDNIGRLTSITDPLGNVKRYGYNNVSRLTSVTDRRGQLVKQITYDDNGRVTEQQFADGGYERYSYVLSGSTVTSATITDALGRTDTKQFNFDGYVIAHTDPLGQTSRITRSLTTNLPIATEGPCGCTEATRQFDAWGNVTAVTDRLGQTTRMSYEHDFNRLVQLTDKLGRITNFAYDSRGNLTSLTNALNQTTRFTYDANGLLTTTMDPLGHSLRVEYDANGNISAVVDALGNRTLFEHDGIGRPTATIDPLGRRVTRAYDALSRLVRLTDAAGQVTRFKYDPNGNLERVTDALGNFWFYEYDGKNRLISQTDPLGRVQRMGYDANDELISLASPSGRVTSYTYDPRGQILTRTNLLGERVSYTYDNTGHLSTLVDQRGQTTTYKYDELFRPVSRQDPLGQTTALSYDASGNMTGVTDRLGRRTSVTYDALNRAATIVFPDATVTNFYDVAGRLTRRDDTEGGSAAWTYDDTGRLLSETTPAGVVSYAYDAAHQPLRMTASNRAPVSYGYDAAGRLQTITQGSEAFTYTYDVLSRPSVLQRPNGVMTAYGYNAAGRLERLTHSNGLNQLIEDYRYSYNSDDEIEAITSLASAHTLPAPQGVGPADANNRVAQFGANSFGFDNVGQTVSKTGAPGTTAYGWDARGRMIEARLSDGQIVDYGYDALGRRASRTVGGVKTSFLYDGADVVLDKTSDGSAVDYLNGMGVDQKLRQSGGASGSLYFLDDHLGSTAALTNQSGAVVERMQYSPFGDSVGSALTRYGYTGRERDAATGLMYHRARWYDPQQGRFISEDPIGYQGGLNLYAYVGDQPLTRTDLFGTDFLNRYVGFVDGLTGDLTKDVRQVIGNDNVDECSGDYQSSHTVGTGVQFVALAVATDGASAEAEAALAAEAEATAAAEAEAAAAEAESAAETTGPTIKPGSSGGETAGKRFPQSVKDQTLADDPTQTCVYCRREGTGTQVDHAIPRARGGDATIENAQRTCPHCNASKGARDKPVNPPPGYTGPWPPLWWP